MSKNAIVIIDIAQNGFNGITQYSLNSFKSYSQRVNADLIVIDTPQLESKYKLYTQSPYPYIRFEKNQIYDLFDTYDRILRLDSDTLIKKDCPNYFDLDSSNLYVTREDVGSRKDNRLKRIRNIKKQLGEVEGWNDFYFNSGVLLASKLHKEAFNLNNIDLTKVSGNMQEQSVLNWLSFYNKFNLVDLGPTFNFLDFFEKDKVAFKKNSYIIHYAGMTYQDKLTELKNDIIKFDLEFKETKHILI
jgi:lipopolysaccharide biosynthesis glycosyltransferase